MIGSNVHTFKIKKYYFSEYFCDRENELETLIENVQNDVNSMLISPWRMGKTVLLHRFFELLRKGKSAFYIYADNYYTRSLPESISVLATAIFSDFPKRTPLGKPLIKLLKSFQTSFSFNQVKGKPRLEFSSQSNDSEKKYTFKQLLLFLESFYSSVIGALGEFQQIVFYFKKNVEDLLKTWLQILKNVHVIVSGSGCYTLSEMFLSDRMPLYASTIFLQLGKIPVQNYKKLISKKFEEDSKTIEREFIWFVLKWIQHCTYYTQSHCSRVYSFRNTGRNYTRLECDQYHNENTPVYSQYRKSLTSRKGDLLVAPANEERPDSFYFCGFLKKNTLGTSSSDQYNFESLIVKEMSLEIPFEN